jgi:MFS family permease
VIGASALGTLFEWYDFFLYGSLASFIAAHFFSAVDPATGFIFALATFAVGFIVRPLGALLFGRIGDLTGRKNTFLATLTLMGVATVLVGVLPGYESIGIAAPVTLVILRILQGLAIGGEFGGAIVYVAEHAPAERRRLSRRRRRSRASPAPWPGCPGRAGPPGRPARPAGPRLFGSGSAWPCPRCG